MADPQEQGPWSKYQSAPDQPSGPWNKYQSVPSTASVAPPQPSGVWEGMKGFGKGMLDTLSGGGMGGGPSYLQGGGINKPIMGGVSVPENTPSNTSQKIGFGAEKVGEFAVPAIGGIKKAAEMLPSAERAGGVLQGLRTSLADVPVETHPAMGNAQRIGELAERGGSPPKFAGQFVERNTPKVAGEVVTQEPSRMTFPEARDFYSNSSRLSTAENMGTNPTIHREVGQFAKNLGGSIQDAANSAGKGQEYAQAMKEYRQAKSIEEAVDVVKKWGLRTFLTGLGGYGAYKLGSDLMGGNR